MSTGPSESGGREGIRPPALLVANDVERFIRGGAAVLRPLTSFEYLLKWASWAIKTLLDAPFVPRTI
jgi:hypothetical protein